MGRLTLNILLSFAQFEREVIGERIRDKFAASRKKGMWMGGSVAARLPGREPQAGDQRAEAAIVRCDLRALRRDRLGNDAGAGAARRGRARPASGQPLRQGLPLQAAQQPGLCRRGRAQGHRLSRRARGDHRRRTSGTRSTPSWPRSPRKRAARTRAADAGAAQGPDLRRRRARPCRRPTPGRAAGSTATTSARPC